MEGKTHVIGGISAALTGTLLSQNGVTVTPLWGGEGMSHTLTAFEYTTACFTVLVSTYVFSMVGAKIPDQDHNARAMPYRDPLGKLVWRALHPGSMIPALKRFDAKHRSWQTHSDLTLLVLLGANIALYSGMLPIPANSPIGGIWSIIFLGLSLGVFSHLFLDTITKEGVWLVVFGVIPNKIFRARVLPEKFRLVPKRSKYFKTGSGKKTSNGVEGKDHRGRTWEDLVNSRLLFYNNLVLALIICSWAVYLLTGENLINGVTKILAVMRGEAVL